MDVDYLEAARAALRVGACFTALVYAEHHCERRNGTVRLPPASAADHEETHQVSVDGWAPAARPPRSQSNREHAMDLYEHLTVERMRARGLSLGLPNICRTRFWADCLP